MMYINTNRPFLLNDEIIEWDIHSANVSIIKEYNLLPESEIDKISQMEKSKRVKHVGLIMKNDKTFAKNFESKFTEVTNKFVEQNNLDIDYDVLSVKKDAVFVISKPIKNPIVGTHIEFTPKNNYHGYLQLSSYEFYFDKKNIDVKGISDDLLPLHQYGILYLLSEVMSISEKSNMNRNEINLFIKDFVDKYKKKELDFDFYREFNTSSKFKCIMFGRELLLDNIDDSMLEYANIEYNYINIILPLIRVVC